MSTNLTATSVALDIIVDAAQRTAFETFTTGIGSWWPPEHHILEGTLDKMVFEPKVGGHVYDVATDGSECRWSRVLAYEPPARVVFSWDISPSWQLETDPAKTSEIEVRFVALDADTTRVELEHRHLDRHGDGWEGLRDMIGTQAGWGSTLRAFAERLTSG
ncbi:MAG TPA: SRPBCC family protein [Acidimicrobiales bacterium]|jgi:uncharacterized protein YndB with AHSA1/START domain|nr:SRPBCC family protein [Acidimicrobiales bacterium]